MKFLIVLLAVIMGAFALPQFYPAGHQGGFGYPQQSFGASGSQAAASAQSQSFNQGGGFPFGPQFGASGSAAQAGASSSTFNSQGGFHG